MFNVLRLQRLMYILFSRVPFSVLQRSLGDGTANGPAKSLCHLSIHELALGNKLQEANRCGTSRKSGH